MAIEIKRVNGIELHHRYPGQQAPQPVYVSLDGETGELSASYCGIIGSGVPMAVYHGRVLCWRIPALRADAANALLDRIAPLAEQVCDGFELVWDGHNHVGQLDDGAQAASDAIAALCDRAGDGDTDQVQAWDASDWFGGLGGATAQARQLGITVTTTDEQLAEIVEREENNPDIDVLEGAERHLQWVREQVRVEVE